MAVIDSNTSTSTSASSELKSPGRRVIKAKHPPAMKLEDGDPKQIVEESEKDFNMVPSIKDSAVMHEEEEERKAKWRDERLHAQGEKQDERRDKKIDEIRRHAPTPQTSSGELQPQTETRVLPEFSVQPQFPEHKRSVDNASLEVSPRDDEPVEKKLKASGPDDKLSTSKGIFSSENRSKVLRMALPAVAFAGIALFFALRYNKKR